ncbi:MAG: magnesium/cobalt transporter CorA [Pirellulaceae bacterium]
MFRKQHPQVGARPGTLMIANDSCPTRIRVFRYSPDVIREQADPDVASLRPPGTKEELLWIDIQGLGDEPLLRNLAEQFHIHPLALEDVVNIPQRPKCEEYGDQLLIVVKEIHGDNPRELDMHQVSIVLGPRYILTFQQTHADLFAPIRQRLQPAEARLRNHGTDYLAYAAIDTVIDNYYSSLDMLGECLERWEDKAVSEPTPTLLQELNLIKNRVADLRRGLRPQIQALQHLAREQHSAVSHEVQLFLRDPSDHCVQTMEVLEMYREMISNLLNTYLTAVSQHTNEVMKVLTIISSVFVPLTFIAGIYGMNFQHMPELGNRWAYPTVWLTMILVALGMLSYFYRKRWIGFGKPPASRSELVEPDSNESGRSIRSPDEAASLRHQTTRRAA